VSPAVKTSLFFIALLAGLTWAFSFLFEADTTGVTRNDNGEIKYFGPIDSGRFEELKRLYQRGDRILIRSNGGDLNVGMAFGDFIHKNRIPIEIVDFCISSCANYVFLSAPIKTLNRNSLVVFHGGPKQKNFLDQMERAYAEDAPVGTSYGVDNYEAVVTISEESRYARQALKAANNRERCPEDQILNFDGRCVPFSAAQRLNFLIKMEETLYDRVDPFMDKNIPYYGQLNDYESTYQSYRYFGFYYDLETLERLKVSGIELKDGVWEPERNPLFDDVYLVEL
jgi:hypothetical protein